MLQYPFVCRDKKVRFVLDKSLKVWYTVIKDKHGLIIWELRVP